MSLPIRLPPAGSACAHCKERLVKAKSGKKNKEKSAIESKPCHSRNRWNFESHLVEEYSRYKITPPIQQLAIEHKSELENGHITARSYDKLLRDKREKGIKIEVFRRIRSIRETQMLPDF